MRAGWTVSGACTSGSIALRWAATSRVCGGAVTMSTQTAEAHHGDASNLHQHFRPALRCKRGGDDRVVWLDVSDGRHGNARRLDDVHDLDADAGPDVVRRRGHFPRHVDGDDG